MENSCVVQRTASPERWGGDKSSFFLPLHVKPRPGMTGLRRLTFEERVRSAKLAADFAQKMRPQRKTRPGGQPDGSSYTGAWGGWALAPNTASMGRDYRSHRHRSREGRRTFKRPANFFNFWATIFGRYQAEIIARRGDGLRERPTCQTPWRHPAGSSPWSRERPDEPRLFQLQGYPKPRQPAPPAR